MSFDSLWSAIEGVGRHPSSGGYRRYAWTTEDAELSEWFAGEAVDRGLDVSTDRAGNQWAWWGDPDAAVAAGRPGLVLGSHLDSVPDGGAYDGPLGVISAFAALDALRAEGFDPVRPLGIVRFVDEEGARFGVACAGSQLLTGSLAAGRALALADGEGTTMAEAMAASGHDPAGVGPDAAALGRIGTFVELHVEQGRGLVDLGRPLAVASSIWPHGRWRFELDGQANHAGTTRLADRDDPTLVLAEVIRAARRAAAAHRCVATVGKIRVEPNGVNAIASRVTAWLDARGPEEAGVRAVAAEVAAAAATGGAEESFTGETVLDPSLRDTLATLLADAPVLPTGAGHDAGTLARAGVPSALLFVRNPTGVSHSPAEFAERDDCLEGVAALTRVVRHLGGVPAP